MRWDDDEKKIRFNGTIVCPTSLFEEVVVAMHSYGHPRVEQTVEFFDRTFWCLAYDLPRDRRNLSPDIAKHLGRCHECQATKARRGKQPETSFNTPSSCRFNSCVACFQPLARIVHLRLKGFSNLVIFWSGCSRLF